MPTEWDTRVETLYMFTKQIRNNLTQQTIIDRYVKTLYLSKKTPNDRALSVSVLNKMIRSFVENIVDYE